MDIRVYFNFTVWNQILHCPNSGLIKYKAKRTDTLWYTLSTHVVLQIISSIYFVLKDFYVPRINHNHIIESLAYVTGLTFSSYIFFLGVECRSSSFLSSFCVHPSPFTGRLFCFSLSIHACFIRLFRLFFCLVS